MNNGQLYGQSNFTLNQMMKDKKHCLVFIYQKKKNDYFKLLKNFLEKTIAHVP